jgi:hypothetical protein
VWGLFFPYGAILQVLAIVHFVRTRPDGYWIWIIIFAGPIGALAYLAIEAAPDLVAIPRGFKILGRNKRINQLNVEILDNPSPGNFEELGDLYLDAHHFQQARAAYDRAITPRTTTPHAFYGRALGALGVGDYAAALPDFEHVVALDPQHDYNRAIGLLALALSRTGQTERAQLAWQRAIAANTTSEVQYNYAAFLREQGRYDEAREWAERLLTKKATLPRYLKRRERPWFRKATALLKSLPARARVPATT